MAARTIIFLMSFMGGSFAALFVPLLGVFVYIMVYNFDPESQWWGAPIRGVRYSMIAAGFLAAGMILNYRTLRFGRALLLGQEKLILLFLAIVWLSLLTGIQGMSKPGIDHQTVKLAKIVIFTLMFTHVVTRLKDMNFLFWMLLLCVMGLSVQAYFQPASAMKGGRLNTVGGSDFAESNNFAAYCAAMLPLIGVQVLKSKLAGKVVAAIAGAFTLNAILLTRSRGAVLGMSLGMIVALIISPQKYRKAVMVGIVVASVGGFMLMDKGFIRRASTIKSEASKRDESASSRLAIWKASLSMLKDRPLGVGAGNFFQAIGKYSREHEGRDAHNTIVRCYGELGIGGLAVLALLAGNAFLTIRRANRKIAELPQPVQQEAVYASYGIAVSLVMYLGSGITTTLLYNEALWWLLAMPVCLTRAVNNALEDAKEPVIVKTGGQSRHNSRAATTRQAIAN